MTLPKFTLQRGWHDTGMSDIHWLWNLWQCYEKTCIIRGWSILEVRLIICYYDYNGFLQSTLLVVRVPAFHLKIDRVELWVATWLFVSKTLPPSPTRSLQAYSAKYNLLVPTTIAMNLQHSRETNALQKLRHRRYSASDIKKESQWRILHEETNRFLAIVKFTSYSQ